MSPQWSILKTCTSPIGGWKRLLEGLGFRLRQQEDILRRFASMRVVVYALLAAGAAQGQHTASGRTVIGAGFEPAQPVGTVAAPPGKVMRGQPVIGREEYLRRKDELSRRSPVHVGPPRLEFADWLAQGREPAALPRQPLMLSPTSSFEGIQQTLFAPPDPDMAAGPDDLIMVVNSSVARYSKAGQQTSLLTLQQWFNIIIPAVCSSSATCQFFDPTIRYDSLHGRFLILAFSEDTTTLKSYFVLSVSNGATFESGWKNWAFEASLNGATQTLFEVDFPMMGYDNNAVYLTGNMLNALGTLQYAKLRILKKTELYNPASTAVTFQDIWDLRNEDNSKASSLRPAQLRGRPGTGTPPGIVVNASDVVNADHLTLWRIENPTTATPAAVRTTLRNIWRYDYPAVIAQQGSVQRLDPGDSRVLKAISRNGVLYTARNSGYTTEPVTVTYDRIELAGNKVTLQARHVNGNYFFPAFDVPASLGPGNAMPNKQIAGTTTDATGALTFVGISEVKAGEDTYQVSGGRWGDYFGGAVDPVQGGLWVYGEYAKQRSGAAGRWGTWAGYFPWSTSPQFADVASSNPFYDFINVMRLWGITSGCSATGYCPANNVTRAQMAVFVIRAMMGDSFTFPAQPFFTDVPSTHVFFSYIQKMRELGITSGCGAGLYCPDANVTREQMAAFIVRGKLISLHGDNFPFPQTAYFADAPPANPFFKFIQKMRELGITAGCGPNLFCPVAEVTREQMAAFVVRAFLN